MKAFFMFICVFFMALISMIGFAVNTTLKQKRLKETTQESTPHKYLRKFIPYKIHPLGIEKISSTEYNS